MEGRMWELAIPLRSPFVTATGNVRERRLVVVEINDGSTSGWGEAAPYPGATPDTVEDAWSTLERGSVLSPTAAAAIDEAEADLDARQKAIPLWQAIDGSRRPVPMSIAVGLDEDPVERVGETGADAAKLKIRPGVDIERVAALLEEMPDISVGVDANGSYTWDERDALLDLDGLGVAYIEQPFGAADLPAHARLRDEIVAPVALDEPIDSEDAAIRAIEAGACDIVVVKPGRVGISAARAIHDVALAGGLRIKASGLIETEIGRAHTRAVASLPGAVHSDVAEASWYLSRGVGSGDRRGTEAWDEPGIGFSPDPGVFAPYVVRESVLGSRIWD
ncbi:MAG: enolase C-terminal domain-like protein [Actinomycetota bacterium]